MVIRDSQKWRQKLAEAYFPIDLSPVYVGDSDRPADGYRAIVDVNGTRRTEPFAIVTDRYRLIRNQDAMDLGYEAFEHVFGPNVAAKMEVFNVVLSATGGNFLADLTASPLHWGLDPSVVRLHERSEDELRHTFFLRVTNSYNRTQAFKIEVGICRWICRNGMIFGERSIRLKDPHSMDKQELLDVIASKAESLSTKALQDEIGAAYGLTLPEDMTFVEGVWQTLELNVPPVNPNARNARQWEQRCAALVQLAGEYEGNYGRTVFSVLQAASQWTRDRTQEAPVRRGSYERRCGSMLEEVRRSEKWPERKLDGVEQLARIANWADIASQRRA